MSKLQLKKELQRLTKEQLIVIFEKMRTFAGGDELVNRLLEKYRVTCKRRKNMMEALNSV